MNEFKIEKNREFLMKRMGDLSQLAGAKRYELVDGKSKGIEAVDIKTGTGFCFTILPGRGMDIAWAEYKGIPISYISKTGIVGPSYYENEGFNWLRNFFAGLLTTCGLSNVGGPCEDDDALFGTQKHGLHGRISNMGADNVSVKEEWQGNDFVMTVSGRLRESMVHCENLTLKREVTAKMGENYLTIQDIVENEGFTEKPLMILYHINLGYPILDEGSRLVNSSKGILPLEELAKKNFDLYNTMQAPVSGTKENVYFHDLNTDDNGVTYIGIINDKLDVGVYLKFNKNELCKFTQWKMLNESEYVLGLEPANCYPVNRVEQRKKGDLETIKPGEIRKFEIEIGILTDLKQIQDFESKVKQLG